MKLARVRHEAALGDQIDSDTIGTEDHPIVVVVRDLGLLDVGHFRHYAVDHRGRLLRTAGQGGQNGQDYDQGEGAFHGVLLPYAVE